MRRGIRSTLVLALVATSCLATPTSGTAAPSTAIQATCPAAQFVGVRGSGEKNSDGDGYGNTINSVRMRVLSQYPDAQTFFVDYQAIPVDFLNPRYLPNYRRSINQGIAVTTSFINSFHTRCPGSAVVLAGYSQGAHVAGDAYQGLGTAVKDKVVGVALIGDPRFNPDQPRVDVGTYDVRRRGIWQLPGGGPMRTIAASRMPAIHSYCLAGDPVCNYSLGDAAACARPHGNCAHLHYIDSGYTNQAGDWLNGRLGNVAATVRWSQEGFDAARTGVNLAETTVSASNVGNLRRAWQYSEPDGWQFSRAAVSGDTVVFTSLNNSTLATRLDAVSLATGTRFWQTSLTGIACNTPMVTSSNALCRLASASTPTPSPPDHSPGHRTLRGVPAATPAAP